MSEEETVSSQQLSVNSQQLSVNSEEESAASQQSSVTSGEEMKSQSEQNPKGPEKTQGVKEVRGSGGRAVLEKAAKRAAGSGNRTDVQEYMRIRRSFV